MRGNAKLGGDPDGDAVNDVLREAGDYIQGEGR